MRHLLILKTLVFQITPKFQLAPFGKDLHKNVITEPSTSNVLVIDSASCKDGGHYFCKIRRCDYHT